MVTLALLLAAATPVAPTVSDSLRSTVQSRAVASVSWQGAISGKADRGVTWPERSTTQYVFGGGLWLGGPSVGGAGPTVVMAYNPLTGRSWMQPGTAASVDMTDAQLQQRYGVRLGTDEDLAFLRQTLAADHHTVAQYTAATSRLFDPSSWTFKTGSGPMNVDVTQHTFGWTSGLLKDAVLLVYEIQNVGSTPIGPLHAGFNVDPDLVDALLPTKGVDDDMMVYTSADAALRMVRASSGGDIGGEMGVVFIETATRASDGSAAPGLILPERQLGLHAVNLLNTTRGLLTNEQRWKVMSDVHGTADTTRGDVSAVLSTGGIMLAPGQVTRFAVALVFGKAPSAPAIPDAVDAADVATVARAVYNAYYAGAATTDVVAGQQLESAIRTRVEGGSLVVDVPVCDASARVDVVGIEGNVVATGNVEAGASQYRVALTGIASGAYFVRHSCGGATLNAKISIMGGR